MKNILLSTIACLIVFAGCYDLDRAPFDQPSSSTFWKTEDQCVQGLMGIYSTFKKDDLFGKQFLIDINSDVASGYDQYEPLQLGTCTPTTGFLNGKWQNGYNTIQAANLAIRSIAGSEIDAAAKAKLVGEAKFLRALAYFHLMDYFGALPLYDEKTDLEVDINNLILPRNSLEETRAFIIKDLKDAADANLPDKWSADNYGRATGSSVHALLGKVQLYNKEYGEAIKSFEQVLDPKYGHQLHADFNELFSPSGKGSSEMVFCIVNSGGVGRNYGMPFAFFAGTRNCFGSCWNNSVPSTNLGDMYEYKDGRPFSWDELFPGYTDDLNVRERVLRVTVNDSGTEIVEMPDEAEQIKAMYDQRDPRMAATVIAPYMTYKGWYANAPKNMLFVFAKNANGGIMNLNETYGFMRNNRGGWETYFWKKFIPEYNWDGAITDRAHTPVNYPVIRLADVYLMLAECYNETNNQDKAVEYINKVRARVGMAAINSGPDYLEAKTKDAVFQRIFRERAFELANEGHRDSDLRRWRLSHLLLNKDDYGITGKRLFTRKFNENRDYLWPIPSDEIEKNSSLTQNPGW
ncbi:MAG: RagB/SusD family nutrient uptake outer membrane protein [Tannerellaceae bacterium]|jgi:tetratricopeptide (TPR) repeat protein|nr:RagB/SusD family nutrient uptake outer membrane protein [Tannerellaceae bacterium]